MSFVLQKVSILEGQGSMVSTGHKVIGKLYIKGDLAEEPKEIFTLDEVELNSPVLVLRTYYDFIRTSPIQKISKNEDGSLELTTETSVYHIQEVK